VIDSGWLLGFTAILVAAVLPSREGAGDPAPETRPLGMLLPYVVIVLAVLVALGTRRAAGLEHFASYTIGVLVLLMVVRQVLTMQENTRLTRYLEERVVERTSELRLSQARFRALVEHSSDVVTLVTPAGEIRYQSDSGALVLGHRGENLVSPVCRPAGSRLGRAARLHPRGRRPDAAAGGRGGAAAAARRRRLAADRDHRDEPA
jgi:PAS domain-containing protein